MSLTMSCHAPKYPQQRLQIVERRGAQLDGARHRCPVSIAYDFDRIEVLQRMRHGQEWGVAQGEFAAQADVRCP
jgi:hypothetical protein